MECDFIPFIMCIFIVWSEWVGEWVDDVWLREKKSEWMSDWKRRFKEIYTDLIWILTLACV